MKDHAYLNVGRLPRVIMQLTGVEGKFLLCILSYMSSNNLALYINDANSRAFIGEVYQKLTKERICVILSSLAKKGIIKREGQGVYSVDSDLYLPVRVGDRKFNP